MMTPAVVRALVCLLSLSLSNGLLAPPLRLQQPHIFIDPADGGDLLLRTNFYGFVTSQSLSSMDSQRTYAVGSSFVDLVQEKSGSGQVSARELIGQNFFQTPLISAIYERGYRQNFATAGFPGVDKEFEEANFFFMSSAFGDDTTLLDLSCGSGFMTRKFIRSSNYRRIMSCDLSRTMLGETRQRILGEGLEVPLLFRADSARLPLKTESVNYIHCGAAFHCYPNLSDSLSEIYRSLKIGGKLFASTFFINAFTGGNSGFYLFRDEEELVNLLVAAGFSRENVSVRREGRACAIIKASK